MVDFVEIHGDTDQNRTIVLGIIVPIRYSALNERADQNSAGRLHPVAFERVGSVMTGKIADQVPWSDSLTTYDKVHFTIYMRFLDAAAEEASYEEMAHLILGIDPQREPERARNAARSHLDRANWMVTTGYKELFAS
ncbi:DUF2285 domain-containing protein [Mesorhizobium sp. M00.F.Ca.ET.217.01.1.1]|nr:MAG: DUF2285 domain-containing protein [Mesorhizobium sp.]TGQ18993.1 DUF2285 domain-containing protein [Mesorhizobium sp. M00.F.Ca.ET.217.01.1.1]TGV90141.1 DUF2285 domain-containing protein [Mesorhizobium sp. M00.F.Ca.ET.158.01.1.1]